MLGGLESQAGELFPAKEATMWTGKLRAGVLVVLVGLWLSACPRSEVSGTDVGRGDSLERGEGLSEVPDFDLSPGPDFPEAGGIEAPSPPDWNLQETRVEEGVCIPFCDGKPCGAPDGCGGKCGECTGGPRIRLSPTWVDFGLVYYPDQRVRNVNVFNDGDKALEISGVEFWGDETLSVIFQGDEMWPAPSPGIVTSLPVPLVLEPGEPTYFKVRFAPKGKEAATASLVIHSNDPANPKAQVQVTANKETACLEAQPEAVPFGGQTVGKGHQLPITLKSCGALPVKVKSVSLAPGSSLLFGLDLGDAAFPIELAPGQTMPVDVVYEPVAESPTGPDGDPVLDLAEVSVMNNSLNPNLLVPVSGAGVAAECPTAVIVVSEGHEVIPQTVLHLFGDESIAGKGKVKDWKWSVDQPSGSQSYFSPSSKFPNPTFEANVAGIYTFHLTVFDDKGTPSCFPAEYEVIVIPDEAIHVELLWSTPDDPDETDIGPEAGSDLDLHFLHPWAAGPDLDGDGKPDGWFDIPFDCFWFNAHPNWGSYDPSENDDPGLDRDDTDGAGPENINLDNPEPVDYRIGVHYWNDHGYGPSYATVRIYVYAQLVVDVQDVFLVDSDMWEVGTFSWPKGKFTMCTDEKGGFCITPDYHNPYFFQ